MFYSQWVEVDPIDVKHTFVKLLPYFLDKVRTKTDVVIEPSRGHQPEAINAKLFEHRAIARYICVEQCRNFVGTKPNALNGLGEHRWHFFHQRKG